MFENPLIISTRILKEQTNMMTATMQIMQGYHDLLKALNNLNEINKDFYVKSKI